MSETPVRIGVLAVQGGFAAHLEHLESVGAIGLEVRTPQDMQGLDGLILPGGESTTITMGIESAGLADPIRSHQRSGKPILGTCAGMIVSDRDHLGLIDISTRRNAFGRQLASFEEEVEIEGIAEGPVRGVFIRAPWVESIGNGVEVLAEMQGHPVAVTKDNVTAISFHPELTGDDRIHRWFAMQADGGRKPGA
ncbi:MAG: pyridoxal 5'-phosphate synthase glutaminase subunit PdxT [Solirubrobacterales bacterium]